MKYQIKAVHMFRVPEGRDLIEYINEYAAKEDIRTAVVSGIGTLQNPVIGYFMEEKGAYKKIELSGMYEITSLEGNISLKDGHLFTHIHINLGDADGKILGGHLIKGNVYVAEIVIIELSGTPLERIPHGPLSLWKPESV